ncbi:microtubule-associated tumor suppressor candidate 2 [Egretta garzetta]|uniref:microtubule-associated tumor suppressor candidate 2 n=1 Tax=Egretta garzetta TaxID=188379 RepID=UPI00051F10FC|nr:microtubule-associated tumor suppressor candidate 2 [Egretta garzetta]
MSGLQTGEKMEMDQSKGLKKEVQKDQDANRPAVSSPKRSMVTATKLHSPGYFAPGEITKKDPKKDLLQRVSNQQLTSVYNGHPKQRPATPKNGFSPKPGESRDAEKQFVQRLKEKCDEQSRQLSNIRDELKRASCGFDVFAITTQHFFRQSIQFSFEKGQPEELLSLTDKKIREINVEIGMNIRPLVVPVENENALVKIKELGVELAKIRDEVGAIELERDTKSLLVLQKTSGSEQDPSSDIRVDILSKSGYCCPIFATLNAARWKKLQSEKEELERRFEEEVKQLRRQQQEELQVLEQRLQDEYNTKRESLQEQHRLQLEQVKLQHQDQVEDITALHEAAMLQLENNHIVAITVLQDENDCKIQELHTAHKLEKTQLEENFEKLRLSLQDQIDTLTFQNHSLKAKADRFEEALKKNTEEQLKIVRAPYLHLEKDLKSLKHVLEMKNHQIHQQEKMIMELEKQAEKNLKLEEKITMLQQQNEELRARIEQNTVITRQLSEENANLQEYVEKEVEEKKKLSRTNEELLWKLQEGDAVSPVKLPPTSSTSFYRCSSGNSSPAKVRTLRR